MVQNLDFAQTFLEVAGVTSPDDMQGESLVPLLKGENEIWNRDGVYYHYYEYPAEHAVKRHYGIATKKYKLIHFYYDLDEWELYDLEEDPQEINNVYNDSDYIKTVLEMKKKLNLLRVKYKDSDSLSDQYIQIYKDNGWID
jgi:arylsulfatase A-like enzyme